MLRDNMIKFDGWLKKQGITYQEHTAGMLRLRDLVMGPEPSELEKKISNLKYKMSKFEKDSTYYKDRVKRDLQTILKWDGEIKDLREVSWWIKEAREQAKYDLGLHHKELHELEEQLAAIKNPVGFIQGKELLLFDPKNGKQFSLFSA